MNENCSILLSGICNILSVLSIVLLIGSQLLVSSITSFLEFSTFTIPH